jgi:hypothetical protein
MKHLKNALRITFWTLVELPVMLLSFIVVPIALLFVKEEDNHLPSWAKWWETYDYDINGDPPWQGPEHANGQQRTYYWRLRWLLRNKAGYFSYTVTGFEIDETVVYRAWGDVYTSNIPGHSGFLYAECDKGGKTYPCYYYVMQIGNTSRCVRLYFGWKFRHDRPVNEWPKHKHLAAFVNAPGINQFGVPTE